MSVTVDRCADADDALLCWYPRESSPQPVYLELDCERETLSVGYDGNIGGGMSFDVWHGRTRRWKLPGVPRGGAANSLMDRVLSLAQCVVDGYSSHRDMQSNLVGRLDEDALEAEQDIGAALESLDACNDMLNIVDAADWFVDGTGVSAATTDVEIETMATDCERESRSDGYYVMNMKKHITQERDRMRAESEDANV